MNSEATKQNNKLKVAFQGIEGSYSYITSKTLYPDETLIKYPTFEAAIKSVIIGKSNLCIIPVENSNAGRVTEVHLLIEGTNFFIIQEYFLPIKHQLLGIEESELSDIKAVKSHPQALLQCSQFIREHKLSTKEAASTAGACLEVSGKQDKSFAAIGSTLAHQMYGLKILAADIQNSDDNETRFLIISKTERVPDYDFNKKYISSLIVEIDTKKVNFYNIISAFSRNKLLIRKTETYYPDKITFRPTKYYIEVEAHKNNEKFIDSFEILKKECEKVIFLGTYLSGK